MDDIDAKLISELEQNARQPVAILARKLGLARTTVQSRLDRLEQDGTIHGYTLRLGQRMQAPLRATVLISYEPQSAAGVLSKLRTLSQVRAARTTAGRFDMQVSVEAQNTVELDQILDQICSAKGVKSSESLIHLTSKIDRRGLA